MSDNSYVANIRVILEMSVPGKWGEDCTVAQVKKQAKEAGEQRLLNALSAVGKEAPHCRVDIKGLSLESVIIKSKG